MDDILKIAIIDTLAYVRGKAPNSDYKAGSHCGQTKHAKPAYSHVKRPSPQPISNTRSLVPLYHRFATAHNQKRQERVLRALGVFGKTLLLPVRHSSFVISCIAKNTFSAVNGGPGIRTPTAS
jgi:hypothetical protein